MCDALRNVQFDGCLCSDSKPTAYKFTRTIIIYDFEFYFEIHYLQYLCTHLKEIYEIFNFYSQSNRIVEYTAL